MIWQRTHSGGNTTGDFIAPPRGEVLPLTNDRIGGFSPLFLAARVISWKIDLCQVQNRLVVNSQRLHYRVVPHAPAVKVTTSHEHRGRQAIALQHWQGDGGIVGITIVKSDTSRARW